MWARLGHFILDYILTRLAKYIGELVARFKRDKAQEEAIKKTEENKAKPRDPEVIKDEEKALNS